MRILIIDDHPFVRKGLLHVLHDEMGSAIIADEAASQMEALSFLEANRYDLVLLDVSLEGRSGLDILSWINKERLSLPVLIISMYPEEQYAIRAMRLGAAGYLTKHSAPAELMSAIKQIQSCGKYISSNVSMLLANEIVAHNNSNKKPHEKLSNREFEIARLIALGVYPRDIAESLKLSVKTINTYRSRLFKKLALRNNAELTKYFIQNNLIS